MPAGNWLDRQPGHVRKFVWALSIAAAVLLLALLVTLREQPDWVPAKSRAFGELVPPSADTDIPHYTPETLPLRTIDEIGAVAMAEPYSLRWRVGVAAPDREPLYFDWPTDRPGWYLNWSSNLQKTQGWFGFGESAVVDLPDPGLGMEFTPMVNVQHGRLFPEPAALQKMAANNPGLTWLIGNEPDVIWQDNTPPEIYAIAYQRAYEAIKSRRSYRQGCYRRREPDHPFAPGIPGSCLGFLSQPLRRRDSRGHLEYACICTCARTAIPGA